MGGLVVEIIISNLYFFERFHEMKYFGLDLNCIFKQNN